MGKNTITSALKKRGTKKDKTLKDRTLYSGGGVASYYKSLREAKLAGKSSVDSFKDINMVMTPQIAYSRAFSDGGFYVHTYVANFEEAIEVLDLRHDIENSIQQFMPTLNAKLQQILNAVKPTSGEEEIIQNLEKSGLSHLHVLFQNLKNYYGTFKTAFRASKKLKLKSKEKYKDIFSKEELDKIKKKIGDKFNIEFKELQSNTAISKQFIQIMQEQIKGIIDNLTSQDIEAYSTLGNVLEYGKVDPREATDATPKDYTDGVVNFLMLSTLLTQASKYTEEHIRKDGKPVEKYQNALAGLSLWEQLNSSTDTKNTNFLNYKAKQFRKDFGLSFEPVTAVLLGQSNVVGQANSKTTATDLEILYNQTENAINNTQNIISASLKTGELIYRSQNIIDFFEKNKKDDEINIVLKTKPLRYFLLNFSLLTEYQFVQSQVGKGNFKDTNLLSSQAIMELYNYIISTIGRFYFTNMFVGYILKNWTDGSDVSSLPKIIMNSSDNKYYRTYDLIQAVKHNTDAGGKGLYLHPVATGALLHNYADFVEAKSKRLGYIRRHNSKKGVRPIDVSYKSLLDDKGDVALGLYKKFVELSENIELFTAADLAVLIEKQGAI